MVGTLLARRAQVHQALMISHLTPYDPAYSEQLAGAQAALVPDLGAFAAEEQSQAMLYRVVGEQARLWAFVENFRIYRVLCLISLRLVLLFNARKGGKGAPPAAVH